MSRIFAKISWWKLVPDSTILLNRRNGNVGASSSAGDWLAYLLKLQKVVISTHYLSLINHSQALWINPETGKEVKAVFQVSKNTISFDPPKWTDIVLLATTKKL